MQPDISQYRAFYDARLGTISRRLIRARLRAIWPRVDGLTIVGLGYATPYLAPFVDTANVVACMPAEGGAVAWPRAGRNRVALGDDTNLPFDDASIDRVILIHSLETSEVWRSLLRQVWRMLRPDGRLIVVAPNRRGLWSFLGDTPFADGHPYSRGQLQRRLGEAMFLPERWEGALYGPPARWSFVMRTGRAWERLGRTLYPGIPGVWIVEASKAMYAPAAPARPNASRRPRLAPAAARQLTRTS
ncbi:MAG: class I SAM-dependent methyltransferase [Alphaproteobacteria bacterium]|nr:class I SAM-dependent methyltransferase [Alphaproteobacteria bacterium]